MEDLQKWQEHLDPCRGGSGIQEFYSVILTRLRILFKEGLVTRVMTITREVQKKYGEH